MAIELNIGSEEYISLLDDPDLRNRYRRTFWFVAWLDRLVCIGMSHSHLYEILRKFARLYYFLSYVLNSLPGWN